MQSRLRTAMSELPNLPADDVLPGGKEANRVVRAFGEPPVIEKVRDHIELSRMLGLVDHERGSSSVVRASGCTRAWAPGWSGR